MRRLMAGIVSGFIAAPLLTAAPARAADATDCHTTLPEAGQSVAVRPAVLVHGWNSNASAMGGLAKAIESSAAKKYYLFCFDYSDRATHWPQGKETHQKLADTIVSLSAAYRRGGGDGRVLAAGHSMGGIAIRFASRDTSQGVAVASVLAGVVTFGTPHIGSPWGGTKLASTFEQYLGEDQLALPPDASDAALCLATLTRRASSCGDVPYLPDGVHLTELGTQIIVHRTLFDIGIVKQTADIRLFGDGIVPQESSSGYLFSGPSVGGSRNVPYRVTLNLDTAPCTYSTDYLKALNAGSRLGRGFGPIGSVIGALTGVLANEKLDSAAVDALLQGKGSLAMVELTAYAYLTPCFHTNLTTNQQLVKDAVTAFARDAAASLSDTEVRRFDFTNATLPANACESGQSGWHTTKSLRLRSGATSDAAFAGVSISDTKAVGFADFNHDGSLDVVLALGCLGGPIKLCCAGRSSHLTYLDVLSVSRDGKVSLIGEPLGGGASGPGDQYGPAERAIEGQSVHGTTITTTERIVYVEQYTETQVGYPPESQVYVDYHYQGGAWVGGKVRLTP